MTPTPQPSAKKKPPSKDPSEVAKRIYARAEEIGRLSEDTFWTRNMCNALLEEVCGARFDWAAMRQADKQRKIEELQKENERLKQQTNEPQKPSWFSRWFPGPTDNTSKE